MNKVTINGRVITYRPRLKVQRPLGQCEPTQHISRQTQEIIEILGDEVVRLQKLVAGL